MSELVISKRLLSFLRFNCEQSLLSDVLQEVEVIETKNSNFWDVTTFFKVNSKVKLIDKIQVVSYFIMNGGRVELDSHRHDFVDWVHLWNYMYEHKYIDKSDYDNLCNHWPYEGVITRMS